MSLIRYLHRPGAMSLLRDLEPVWDAWDMPVLAHRGSVVPKMTCDVSEDKDSYTVRADLPGVPKESISVSVDRDVLTIEAVREESRSSDGEKRHVQERSYGRVSRSFQLPASAKAESAKCTFENGMLSVSFSKDPAPQSTSRKLEIE